MNWHICVWNGLGELCSFFVLHSRIVIWAIGCNWKATMLFKLELSETAVLATKSTGILPYRPLVTHLWIFSITEGMEYCTISIYSVWPCDHDTFDGFGISVGADAMTLKIFQQSRSQFGWFMHDFGLHFVTKCHYSRFGNSCPTCLWQFKNHANSENSKNLECNKIAS